MVTQQTRSITYLVANFGGPRNLKEVEPFLATLLTDRDVIRTKWPQFINDSFFRFIAKRRSKKVAGDYASIGGKSPIYFDTEAVAKALPFDNVLTFHRYIPETHAAFCKQMEELSSDEIHVFPMFPQFTHATTGSIARFFQNSLSEKVVSKLRWVRSYPVENEYIRILQKMILEFIQEFNDDEIILLFSAHGLPATFNDGYQQECEASFAKVMEAFPNILARLSYQSKFGRGSGFVPIPLTFAKR